LALRLGQLCHDGGLQGDHLGQELLDECTPVVGQCHEQSAPVCRVWLSLDQAASFQGVQQGGDAGGGHEESLGEGRRGQGLSGSLEDRQCLAPGLGQPVVAQRLVDQGEERLADLCALALADSLSPGNSCSNALLAVARVEGPPGREPFDRDTRWVVLSTAPRTPRPTG
jgi:hypothetical protein